MEYEIQLARIAYETLLGLLLKVDFVSINLTWRV